MTKFIVGKTYTCKSICDHNVTWSFTVLSRTDATVKIAGDGKVRTKKVYIDDSGNEVVRPLGVYSMAPFLRAESEVK